MHFRIIFLMNALMHLSVNERQFECIALMENKNVYYDGECALEWEKRFTMADLKLFTLTLSHQNY